MAPNTAYQYHDTALEAAHLEIQKLQSEKVMEKLLLDEAMIRIRDLVEYEAKAAAIIARLRSKIRALKAQAPQARLPTKDAGLSSPGVYGKRLELGQSRVAPSFSDYIAG